MKRIWILFFVVVAAVWCIPVSGMPAYAQEVSALKEQLSKPLVVYYSRQGHARMLATALKNHLNADIEEIRSEKKRGVFTIMVEQLFGLHDRQKAPEKDLSQYNPFIVVAPIYFMKLCAPARTFIDRSIPEGKDVYVFTTSGGPLAGFTKNSIRSFVQKRNLNVQGVHGFQIGKKTQADFDNETAAFLAQHPIR
ncbi:MAG: hypothetical protein N3B18_05835 [Desulfobacterota bacterium]|nr:hypothetical protein [Thermodesulfobacteriota bacterium]